MPNEVVQKNEEVLKTEASTVSVIQGFASLESFEFSLRAANLLSKSSLVPKEYQANIPNCVIALNMANRMGADPLMVMQNLYIVHGRPGWSSQFLISTFNTSGKFSALRYEWVGTPGKDDYGCKAWAIEKSTGERLEGSAVTIDMAKKEGWYAKNGSKWQTMPQQMLMYRAASWFVRAYAPELAMGMHTAEELQDIDDQIDKPIEKKVAQEIKEKANKEVIDVDCEPIEKDKADQKEDNIEPEQMKINEDKGPGF